MIYSVYQPNTAKIQKDCMQGIIRQTKYKMDSVKHRLLHNLFVSFGLLVIIHTNTLQAGALDSLICCIVYHYPANNVFVNNLIV